MGDEGYEAWKIKESDPYTFIKADDFFRQVDENDNGDTVKRPVRAVLLDEDQDMKDPKGKTVANPVAEHGRIFRLYDKSGIQSFLLLEFIRPRVWRVRFDPTPSEEPLFTDFNNRTTITATASKLIENLDRLEKVDWEVTLKDAGSHFVLQSVKHVEGKKIPEVQLWLQKDPLQITAVRLLHSNGAVEPIPKGTTTDPDINNAITLHERMGSAAAVIWKTRVNPIRYWGTATILSEQSSVTSRFMGFGEQGGQHLFKRNTFMNYFNFDNMRYQNVYNRGPLDDREPLYHSEPFWMEVASQSSLRSLMGTMVDNYSHTCLDIGTRTDVKHQNVNRIATRFNEFSVMKVAADSVSELIQSYTSIVGKPRLKPRYALGYHQGCYGNDVKSLVTDSVNKYHDYGFPIDGYHIDVDMQREYKTFTIDSENWFQDPEGMFRELRQKGVKCSTNITPHINALDDPNYKTLNEMKALNYAIKDSRLKNEDVHTASMERYINYSGGIREGINPSWEKTDYDPPDQVPFSAAYNSGKEFRGGLYYGNKLGAPTYYPNLNDPKVREWWGKQYQYLFETGLEFVWQDMTSPCIAREYGDMKSLPFRLLLDSDVRNEARKALEASGKQVPQKTAIELWSLYSFNLHKATFQGLEKIHNLSDKLKWRKDRRNFIIGRGSMIGSQRYAGLWTGDNESSWDFLSISVNQVLALGLSGITISGQDVGGFESAPQQDEHCDPQLLIRWYGAYSLLPWFRNHYTKRRYWGPEQPKKKSKGGKYFQEPYAYDEWFKTYGGKFDGDSGLQVIYRAVLPACRWFVQLRYSLMQLLYDTMFENVVTGLPIARSMVITDDQDKTLFSTNQAFTSSQYLVGNDLLVAPRAIIPKIEVRLSTPDFYPPEKAKDLGIEKPKANPITFHVYPGKNNVYKMYLDDGISMNSEPLKDLMHLDRFEDRKANKYCQVDVAQKTHDDESGRHHRDITINSPHNGYDREDLPLEDMIGTEFTVVMWHKQFMYDPRKISVDLSHASGATFTNDDNAKATIIKCPIEFLKLTKTKREAGLTFKLTYEKKEL
ncbi:Alpha-glucosidase 2 [Escovopsis weberi]|uniref:alpha-glucosidase n=1 Tax=Escovopsis weberi TaxID=150374 RepID=A0A0M8N8L7_ESCWE|nr:Alpha-glucosidase 2 [Escovopsis weberi]